MQKQRKQKLTESQVKLKKLLTPIVEGILSENTPIETNSINFKILNNMFNSLNEIGRTTRDGLGKDEYFNDVLNDFKNLQLKVYKYLNAYRSSNRK